MPSQQLEDLKKYGLKPHAFHRVDNPDPGPSGIVITFPHSTFEIRAHGPEVLEQGTEAASSLDAILVTVGKHQDRFPAVRRGS